MLQLQQYLFRIFFAQMTSCFVHYDVVYYPFPVNSQYLNMSGGGGVDSPGCLTTTYLAFIQRPQSAYPF